MIAKKIPNTKKSVSKAARAAGVGNYIVAPERENGLEKCICTGAENFLTSTHAGHVAEMAALAQEAIKSKDPIDHWVLSWKPDERPTPAQAKEAVETFIQHCGLDGHQYIWGLHDDTENLHVHIEVNRVHPDTLKVTAINKGFDREASQQAIALIEHNQGWKKEANARYDIENGKPVLSAKGEKAKADRNKPREPSNRAKAKEIQTGTKSVERIGIEEAAPVIQHAKNWKELHEGLAAIGMRYERDGSGAKIYIGEVGIKASDVDRKAGFGQLQKRLGTYEFPPQTKEYKNAKDFANIDKFDKFGPHPEPAFRRQRMHELRGKHVDGDKDRSSLLLPRHAPDHMEHTKADLDTGVRHASSRGRVKPLVTRIEPLTPNQPGWKEYSDIRTGRNKSKVAETIGIREGHTAERKALADKQKAERGEVLAGNWTGKGNARNALASVLATQQAAEKLELQARQREERKELHARYAPLPQYKEWKEQPQIVKPLQAQPAEQQRTPLQLAQTLKALTHTTDKRGHVTYQAAGRDLFRDEGRSIKVLNERSDMGIAAALATAQQKFGTHLTLTGSAEFQHKAVVVAVANGLTCRFTDPGLDQLREQLQADKYAAERQQQQAEREAAKQQEREKAQMKERQTVTLSRPAKPVLSEQLKQKPAQPVLVPESAPTPQPAPTPQIVADAKEDAYKALLADLKGKGKTVDSIKNNQQYIGTLQITPDGFFATQNNGRSMSIHDLDKLDGHYTSGQKAHITYRNGRGTDKLQGQQQEPKTPSKGRG